MFDYKKENQTKITVFANAMCKLLVRLHKNSLNPIDTAAKDCYFSVYIYFDNQVDSIDHLAFTKVPLFGYMRLILETLNQLDMTHEEWKENLQKTVVACNEFYLTD